MATAGLGSSGAGCGSPGQTSSSASERKVAQRLSQRQVDLVAGTAGAPQALAPSVGFKDELSAPNPLLLDVEGLPYVAYVEQGKGGDTAVIHAAGS